MAGDETFSGSPDILSFEPVPRRARADGWSPEHQRAFIAALAISIRSSALVTHPQRRNKRLLRNGNAAVFTHALFALFLFL